MSGPCLSNNKHCLFLKDTNEQIFSAFPRKDRNFSSRKTKPRNPETLLVTHHHHIHLDLPLVSVCP